MAYVENSAKNARFELDTYKEILEEIHQIRLVILGESGIGKSTLVSRVFGIPEEEAGVSHDRAGEHDIRKGITYDSNRSIIVHDSGGFSSGVDSGVKKVTEFLNELRQKEDVKDQVHCIWYCIACEGDRPGEGFAGEFFSKIDEIAGETPVLVIFTKFDRLVGVHHAVLGRQHQDWSYAQTIRYAEGEALKDFDAKYLKQVTAKLNNSTKKVGWERVGRVQSPERGGVDTGDPQNETGTNGLIARTFDCLESSLKPMWVCTQRQNARLKIDHSVTAGMEYFKIASFCNGVPFIPLKDLAVEMVTANKIFQKISRVWNEDEFLYRTDRETQRRIKDAIFDKNIVQQVASQAWDIFDITGPISQPNNAVKFMKTVAGVTLIHAHLFCFQQSQNKNTSSLSVDKQLGIRGARPSKILPLSSQQVVHVIQKFQKSPQRERLCAQIDGHLFKFGLNLYKSFSTEKLERIIRDAIEVGLAGGNLEKLMREYASDLNPSQFVSVDSV